jgi:hypothetical protein
MQKTTYVVQQVRNPSGEGRTAPIGSKPCDGCGNAVGDAYVRERAGGGTAATKPIAIPDVQGAQLHKGNSGLPAREVGEGPPWSTERTPDPRSS